MLAYRNLLEPPHLVGAFVTHPPRGFRTCTIGAPGAEAVGFLIDFDLTTTLEPRLRRALERAPIPGGFREMLRPKTLFGGTTVTEYFPSPRSADPDAIVAAALERMRSESAAFVILKDIPRDSPLLSAEENEAAADLREACRRAGFVIVAGQALAYVPVDSTSEDVYLAGLSRARRKDLRRKLRDRSSLEIEELATGDRAFDDEAFVEDLVHLYRNVYEQSLIHFDELTSPFLKEVFRARGGTVFVYRQHGELIGYNLCFVHRDRLVDKYVGFAYPQARAANLYFVSWFHNLEWARRRRLTAYVAGWTDPEVKRSLGARFTFTDHAVYPRHKVLRALLRTTRRWFESDANVIGATER